MVNKMANGTTSRREYVVYNKSNKLKKEAHKINWEIFGS